MKFAATMFLLISYFGCGILEALFPLEYPQRYLDRKVDEAELIGTWIITSESETSVSAYFQQGDTEIWALKTPWKSISLYEDGTCEADIVLSWSLDSEVLREPDAPSTCTWRIDSILGYDVDGSFRHVPGLFVRFEHYNKEADMYNVYYSESYIVEENGELVLWNFIGDSVSLFQDFKKASK